MINIQAIIRDKKSNLCAGLDLPLADMKRDGHRLPDGQSRLGFSLNYVKQVAPHAAALKINHKYWLYDADFPEVIAEARKQGLYVIMDTKTADITDTNMAEFHAQKKNGADAITLSPFAGNAASSVAGCRETGLDVFSMCLMSNPEYAGVKNYAVPLSDGEAGFFRPEHLIELGNKKYVPFYLKQMADIVSTRALGGVIGTTGHVTAEELKAVSTYAKPENVFLCPGIGKQGGSPDLLLSLFKADQLLFNVSRGLMFPESGSVGEAARSYKKILYPG